MKEFKGTKERWSYSPMKGEPGHCYAAQVWDSEGNSLAVIDSRYGDVESTEKAKLISAAPDLLGALSAVVEHAKEFGLSYDVYDKAEAAIKKATS